MEKGLNEQLTESDTNTISTTVTSLEDVTYGVSGVGQITVSNDTVMFTEKAHLEIPVDAISFRLFEGQLTNEVILNPDFVRDYFAVERMYNRLGEELAEAKTQLKQFIESNNTGSVNSNGMEIKFTPATTTTTIDSTKLKKEFPEIAAQCSKVSPRKSSISIKESN